MQAFGHRSSCSTVSVLGSFAGQAGENWSVSFFLEGSRRLSIFFWEVCCCEFCYFFGQGRICSRYDITISWFLLSLIFSCSVNQNLILGMDWFNGVTKTSHVTETFVETSCSNMTLSSWKEQRAFAGFGEEWSFTFFSPKNVEISTWVQTW